MKLPVRIREEAEVDLSDAAIWYEQQRAGLGQEFLDQALSVLDSLPDNPSQFLSLITAFGELCWAAFRLEFTIVWKVNSSLYMRSCMRDAIRAGGRAAHNKFLQADQIMLQGYWTPNRGAAQLRGDVGFDKHNGKPRREDYQWQHI